jgi:membrane protease YdiL (CAAX protease family)
LMTLLSLPGSDGLGMQPADGGMLTSRAFFQPVNLLLGGLSLFGVGFSLLIGMLGFVPTVRRLAARVLPIEADSFVHATALATVLGLTATACVPLMVLGEPPVLSGTAVTEEMKKEKDSELRSTIYGFLWTVPATVFVVGYPVRRNFGAALRRIGLVRPKAWQLALAVSLVPVLVGAMLGVDAYVGDVWQRLGWPATDSKAFDELMSFAINPLGAVIIGVTAGLGEELAVRGVLQPRLGIVLSNLFFTSLHALQYNWDGLLSVFLVGLALGVLRKYTNTTTSAVVHGGYDFVLVMIDVLKPVVG